MTAASTAASSFDFATAALTDLAAALFPFAVDMGTKFPITVYKGDYTTFATSNPVPVRVSFLLNPASTPRRPGQK